MGKKKKVKKRNVEKKKKGKKEKTIHPSSLWGKREKDLRKESFFQGRKYEQGRQGKEKSHHFLEGM